MNFKKTARFEILTNQGLCMLMFSNESCSSVNLDRVNDSVT